jgi:ankyrin repeat protein
MIASSVGNMRLVCYLLKSECNANSENENKQRPLHYACSKNHADIARELLRHGALVNAADRFGSSALHRAASKGNIQCVNVLLDEYKASVDLTDNEGNTPL